MDKDKAGMNHGWVRERLFVYIVKKRYTLDNWQE